MTMTGERQVSSLASHLVSPGKPGTNIRTRILACVAAANRLSEALLATEMAGYRVMMAYEGMGWQGMSDGLWTAEAFVRESTKRPDPDETVSVRSVGTFVSRKPVLALPAAGTLQGTASVNAESIARAFAGIPCRLLVSWQPGRCLTAGTTVDITSSEVDGHQTLVVGLRAVTAPRLPN